MESNEAYVDNFIRYIKEFIDNIRSDDPLPVRAPSYRVTHSEIDGQIIDIVHHYLSQRECPPYLRCSVAHTVWKQMRNPEQNGNDDPYDTFDHYSHTYEPIKLIQEVANRANKELMLMQASITRTDIESFPRYLPVSQYAIKNTRRKMEDRCVIIQDLNTLYDMNYGHPHAYYGIFDGHAGADAAIYTAAHLHQYLVQNPLYDSDPAAALKHAFYITDTNFVKKVERERLKGGTTAVVALVREKRLVVAWLGDSQALLVRKRDPLDIVLPHKPESPSERKRIESCGGCVVNIQGTWRVLGQLAVSRAIGDADYKPYLSAECDIKSLEIDGDEDFMILACDGLWDTLKPSSAVNIVYSYLAVNNGETDGVGRCLVEAARSLGSEDNITAVVVFLRPVATLMEEEATRVSLGQVSPDADSFVSMHNSSLPHSINSIFSPPAGQNDSATSIASSTLEQIQEIDDSFLRKKVPAVSANEGVPPFESDSDEGVCIEIPEEKPISLEGAIASNPTEAEVDAALAELDSIPDGTCEAGDLEDEDSEEEEEDWKYYNMKPQTEPQEDDLLFDNEPSDTFSAQAAELVPSSVDEHLPSESTHDPLLPPAPIQEFVPSPVEEVPPPPMHIDIPIKTDSSPGSGSPTSGSPKMAEGFITSVELNAPEESYSTNLAINQSTEYFNTGQFEQNSGPFSVYVSSSPEPASIEVPPQQQQSTIEAVLEPPVHDSIVSAGSTQEILSPDSPSVEIVHAQSTVEVITPGSPIQIDSPLIDDDGKPIAIPDIMTQSMTGDTHPDMFLPHDEVSDALVEQLENLNISEPYNTFDSTNDDLFQNIPEANLLDHQNFPVEPAIEKYANELPSEEVKTEELLSPDEDLIIDVSVELDYRSSNMPAGEIEPLKDIKIPPVEEPPKPAEEATFTSNEPDLVKDLEPSQIQPEESPMKISPMEKIQQEFEQIEQAADEVISGAVKADAEVSTPLEPPQETSPSIDVQAISPVIEIEPASPVVMTDADKPKKEAPKAAPRSSTTKPGLKTTPRPTTTTTKTSATKDQPKEVSKAPQRTSRLSTTPKFAPKTESKKATPNTKTTATTTSRTTFARASSKTLAAKTIPSTATSRTSTTTTSKLATTKLSSTTRPAAKSLTASTTRRPLSTSSSTAAASGQTTKTATTRSVTSTSTRLPSTTAATKRVPTTRPLSSVTRQPAAPKDSTKASSAGVTKTTSSLTTTTSARRPISATRPSSSTTKDSKNTTNKILSTSRTTTTTTSRISSTGARTASTTTTRSFASNKRPISSTRPGLKSKIEQKVPPKSIAKTGPSASAVANGENKIVEEEATCEVEEKRSEVESEQTVSSPQDDLLIPDKSSEVPPVIKEVSNEVLVNGDHY